MSRFLTSLVGWLAAIVVQAAAKTGKNRGRVYYDYAASIFIKYIENSYLWLEFSIYFCIFKDGGRFFDQKFDFGIQSSLGESR